MSILDKYISRKFIATLLFALIAFTCIFVIIDLIGYLDKFIDRSVPKIVIGKYYAFYFPYIIVLSLPVAMLLASLFSIGQMSRYNELIAMQASGMSLLRILLPIFLLGLTISLVTMYAGEKIVPFTNQKKIDIYNNYVDKSKRAIPDRNKDIYIQVAPNQWLNIGYFDIQINTAHNVCIQYFNDDFTTIFKRLDVLRMVWQDDKWVLLNGYTRKFSGNKEEIEILDKMEKPDLTFKPDDLSKAQKKAEEMNYWELKQFIEKIKKNGGNPNRWLVDLYLKIAFPFANLIIVLFGAPLSSRKTRSGPAVSFGISLLICFLYFGIIKTGQSLGHNGTLSPMLAAWIGNMLFGTAAIFIFFRMNK